MPGRLTIAASLRVIALFEAAKGILVLLVGCGALALVHQDMQRVAARLVAHLHLNLAKHYPRIFVDLAAQLTDARLWLLALTAALYALMRFIEAYGLWHGRRWAQWLAVLSGGIYIPFELHETVAKASWLSSGALLLNVLIVGIMAYDLHRKNRRHHSR